MPFLWTAHGCYGSVLHVKISKRFPSLTKNIDNVETRCNWGSFWNLKEKKNEANFYLKAAFAAESIELIKKMFICAQFIRILRTFIKKPLMKIERENKNKQTNKQIHTRWKERIVVRSKNLKPKKKNKFPLELSTLLNAIVTL